MNCKLSEITKIQAILVEDKYFVTYYKLKLFLDRNVIFHSIILQARRPPIGFVYLIKVVIPKKNICFKKLNISK